MSLAADMLAEGLSALHSCSGEDVTFRGQSVSALVDRMPGDPLADGSIGMTFDEGVTVSILVTAVESAPEDGEQFVDSFGYRLTIAPNGVRHRGLRWECRCTLTRHVSTATR